MRIIAHRGFSARHPEMTRAAYQAAIEWSATTGSPLGLECDVHFSADDHLICLHDLSIERTSKVLGWAIDLTVAQLKRLDFGSRSAGAATPAEQELVTLAELLVMVRDARARGVDVSLVIETKHPNPRGGEVERRVAEMLADYGWDQAGSPVRVISFSPAAMHRFAKLLPDIERSLLIDQGLGQWNSGDLPTGVTIVGIDIEMIRQDPSLVDRFLQRGHVVHAWTLNDPGDIRLCAEIGVTNFTSDAPNLVAELLHGSGEDAGSDLMAGSLSAASA